MASERRMNSNNTDTSNFRIIASCTHKTIQAVKCLSRKKKNFSNRKQGRCPESTSAVLSHNGPFVPQEFRLLEDQAVMVRPDVQLNL